MKTNVPLVLVSLVLFAAPLCAAPLCAISPPDDSPYHWNSPVADSALLAQQLSAQMSDEQALAQTFMLAWFGAEPSPLIIDWIVRRNIGGVKIFGWNTDDTLRLAQTVGEMQRNALACEWGIPLLVSTDQEGGMVRHVRGETSQTPGNMAIGASGRSSDAYYSGYFIGRELALLGINMNFAPTVDLHTNRNSTVIGVRSFGDDPVRAAVLGAAFARGQRKWGVISTAKHFPGHGDTPLDSHGSLPRVNAPFETLWERELVPYRMLILEGVPAVMSGHLAFPNTQAGGTPASLSPWFLQDILRDKMNFQGIIITDDLLMLGALEYTRNIPQTIRQALSAGNDMIMLSNTPQLNDEIWTYLITSMHSDPVFRERVRDASRRVLQLKLEHLRGAHAVTFEPDLETIAAGLRLPEGDDFFLSLAARSVTVVPGASGATPFPLTPENSGRVLLAGAGQFEDFFETGRTAFPGAAVFDINSGTNRGAAAFAAAVRNADTVIFCLSNRAGIAALQSIRTAAQESGTTVIVVSVLNPVYLEEATWVDGAVAIYSYAPVSFIAGFSVILGRISGEGKFPFSSKNKL